MRFLRLAAAAALLSAGLAHADSLSTFPFADVTFTDGATGSGAVAVDTTNGTFGNIDLTVLDGSATYVFDGAAEQTIAFDNNSQMVTNYTDAAGDILVLDVPGSTLVGYDGGNLCSMDTPCDGFMGDIHFADGSYDGILSGSLDPAPEPSSILLLGSGLLGAAVMMRRRLA